MNIKTIIQFGWTNYRTLINNSKLNKTIMAIFSGEVTIKVKFKDIQVAVGYGMTSAIIKHRCVQQAYARSPWSKIKNQKDDRFEVIIEKEELY